MKIRVVRGGGGGEFTFHGEGVMMGADWWLAADELDRPQLEEEK